MYSIYDPVSGEKGFFCSIKEKELIDAVLIEHLNTSAESRGVCE